MVYKAKAAPPAEKAADEAQEVKVDEKLF